MEYQYLIIHIRLRIQSFLKSFFTVKRYKFASIGDDTYYTPWYQKKKALYYVKD